MVSMTIPTREQMGLPRVVCKVSLILRGTWFWEENQRSPGSMGRGNALQCVAIVYVSLLVSTGRRQDMLLKATVFLLIISERTIAYGRRFYASYGVWMHSVSPGNTRTYSSLRAKVLCVTWSCVAPCFILVYLYKHLMALCAWEQRWMCSCGWTYCSALILSVARQRG